MTGCEPAKLDLDRDLVVAQLGPQKVQHVHDHFVDVELGHLEQGFSRERADARDDVSGAMTIPDDALGRLARLVKIEALVLQPS